jgi:hypothetical protein
LDLKANVLKEVQMLAGEFVPAPRNSQTMVRISPSAFWIVGGANNDHGPLKDVYELSYNYSENDKVEGIKFKKVELQESGEDSEKRVRCSLPNIEMHTMHLYQEKSVLIIGGRSFDPIK